VKPKSLDHVIRHLRASGLRNTRARRVILETLFKTRGHFTAEELLDRVRASGEHVSRATVYRTLTILVDGGFVESREFQRGQLQYEVMVGQHHHDHLICSGCGAIVEFENEEIEALQEQVAAAHGYVLEQHSLRLYGRCKKCQKKRR